MPSLAEVQAGFVATINEGPDALDPALFAGDTQRVMLGLKAHANTISHARLVALEQTFPRTLETLGKAEFNRISREYCESANARAADSNTIGSEFPAFLRGAGCDPSVIDLAKIEWLWLQSYNAAEAEILNLADLAGIDETALVAMPASAHPAAFLFTLNAPLSSALPELKEQAENLHALLVTRPAAMPAIFPASRVQADIFAAAEKNATIGNLLELAAEQGDEDDALAEIIHLINAGALTHAKRQGEEK